MRFSWTGLILAPLPVPLIFSAAVTGLFYDFGALPFFQLMLLVSCVASYSVTIFLFLPSLFVLSLWRTVTLARVCLLGVVLGGVALLFMSGSAWTASGPNSGPPTEGFGAFLRGWLEDPFAVMFPLAGLVTAALYWWLGRPRRHLANEL